TPRCDRSTNAIPRAGEAKSRCPLMQFLCVVHATIPLLADLIRECIDTLWRVPLGLFGERASTHKLENGHSRDVHEMMRQIPSHLKRRQKQPEVVKRFYCEPHVRYAA